MNVSRAEFGQSLMNYSTSVHEHLLHVLLCVCEKKDCSPCSPSGDQPYPHSYHNRNHQPSPEQEYHPPSSDALHHYSCSTSACRPRSQAWMAPAPGGAALNRLREKLPQNSFCSEKGAHLVVLHNTSTGNGETHSSSLGSKAHFAITYTESSSWAKDVTKGHRKDGLDEREGRRFHTPSFCGERLMESCVYAGRGS